MNCPRCGTNVPEGANYCAECGVHVAGPASDVAGSGSVAGPGDPGTVPRNLMVDVPSSEAVLLSMPMLGSKGHRYPVLEVRAGWAEDPVFSVLPFAKLYWQNAGLVFLSKGERGLWPSIRGPLGEFTEEQIFHHLFGILGPLFNPQLVDPDKDEDGWIKKMLANPATIVIPAPLIISARLERLHGRTYARITTDGGKILSFASNDPFGDLSRAPDKGAFFRTVPMMMRANHEAFFFFATLLHNVFPEDRQLLLDASKKYFGSNPQDLYQLNARLAEKGLTGAALMTEARYHLQRFGPYFPEQLALFSPKLPPDYVPWCFRCGVRALRPLAKYCNKCGLWMW